LDELLKKANSWNSRESIRESPELYFSQRKVNGWGDDLPKKEETLKKRGITSIVLELLLKERR